MAKVSPVRGLGPRTPLATAGRRLLSARLKDIRKLEGLVADGAQKGPVHDLRVASRRLRAALDLLGNQALRSREPDAKALQDALGRVRDAQLQLAWLRPRSPRLAALREQELAAALEGLGPALVDWQRAEDGIERKVRALSRAGRFGGKKVRSRLADALRKVEERAAAARKTSDAKTEHRLRIAVKKLRYLLELAEAAVPEAAPAIDALSPLQQALGDVHDTDVRIALLRGAGVPALLGREERARRLRARKLTRALARVGREPAIQALRKSL